MVFPNRRRSKDVRENRQQIASLQVLDGSLLDVPADYQPVLTPETSVDPYFYAICDLLPRHMRPPFDARAILAEFLEKLDNEKWRRKSIISVHKTICRQAPDPGAMAAMPRAELSDGH